MLNWPKIKRIIKHKFSKKDWANTDIKLTKQDKELFELVFLQGDIMLYKVNNTKSNITYYYCSYSYINN